jgi:hypothetical protein
MKFRKIFMVVVCGITLQAMAQGGPLAQLKKDQPSDVVKMIDRYVGCNHWGGEEPYDEERRKEINQAISSLRCETLEKDEEMIFKRYGKNRRVLEILESAKKVGY